MENYEEKLREIINSKYYHSEDKAVFAKYFPELKENEDERMSKEIIKFLRLPHRQFVGKQDHEKWIGWLEKQNHAWSENDKNLLNRLIGVLDGTNEEDYHEGWEEKFLPWLKSLKERIQPQSKQCEHLENFDEAEKEKTDFVSGQYIECRKSFDEFKEDNSYWFEYVGNDTYIGRSDNILNKKFHITPRQLYRLFTQQHCPKENDVNEETNAPMAYGKYVDECLYEATKHFLSEGEDKYSIADLFYAGVRCGQSCPEKQGEKVTNINGEDYGIDGLYHAIRILEKTVGRVTGYQSDDGILEHKAAINAVKELYEKQSEKSTNIDIDKMVMEYSQTKDDDFGLPVNCMIRAYRKGINDALSIALNIEKKGEKKSADKVEPKFHEGDWILNNVCFPMQIASIKDGMYIFTKGDAISVSFIDENYHLWTINDAMDGDVLVTQPEKGSESNEQIFLFKAINNRDYVDNCIEYYGCVYDGVFHKNKTGYMGTTLDVFYPATKEQCDLLFQQMKESGYEWDSEKKELKKMEVVSKESEDERMRKAIIRILKGETRYASKEDTDKYVTWLEKQSKKKSADEVMKIRRKAYSDGYMHGQDNIAISLGKESVEALEHFVRSIGENGYASPYDNRTKLVYRLLEQLKQIVK